MYDVHEQQMAMSEAAAERINEMIGHAFLIEQRWQGWGVNFGTEAGMSLLRCLRFISTPELDRLWPTDAMELEGTLKSGFYFGINAHARYDIPLEAQEYIANGTLPVPVTWSVNS